VLISEQDQSSINEIMETGGLDADAAKAIEDLNSSSTDEQLETDSSDNEVENTDLELNNEDEDSELSVDDLLDDLQNETTEQPETDSDADQIDQSVKLISDVNALEFVYNGEKFEVKDADHLKELVQKGFNFTEDKQKFATEKEQAYQQFDQMQDDFNKKVESMGAYFDESEKFNHALKKMKQVNSSLYEDVLDFIDENSVEDPYYKSAISQMEQRFQALEQERMLEKEENSKRVRQSEVDSDLNSFKEKIGKVISEAKLSPDWNKLKDKMLEDTKLSAKDAFMLQYGESLLKLQNSKKEVSKVKKSALVKNKPVSAGVGTGKSAIKMPDLSNMSTEEVAHYYANDLG
jgi:hypothetical protein